MFVDLRYFAMLRDQRGVNEEQVELEPGTTVAALYARLFPPGPEGRLPVAFAVNQEYVGKGRVLEDGDEVAFIPPVGGG